MKSRVSRALQGAGSTLAISGATVLPAAAASGRSPMRAAPLPARSGAPMVLVHGYLLDGHY
jgi:hypothetical protein